jgi:phage nucleotide-binding protein
MLIYGDPGVGKTVLAGSADEVPELRKVLLVDVEGGDMSLESRYPNVDLVRVTDFAALQDIYNFLNLSRGHGYNTVVLDTLTEMQKLSMDRIMSRVKQEDPDIEMPRQRDWGINIDQIRTMVRAFRDLPIHTVFTCHSKEDQDQRTGIRFIKPSLSGKLANEVSGFMDIVVYLYVKEDENGKPVRVLMSHSSEQHVAKDRSDTLPQYLQSPTMAKIYHTIVGEAEETN